MSAICKILLCRGSASALTHKLPIGGGQTACSTADSCHSEAQFLDTHHSRHKASEATDYTKEDDKDEQRVNYGRLVTSKRTQNIEKREATFLVVEENFEHII